MFKWIKRLKESFTPLPRWQRPRDNNFTDLTEEQVRFIHKYMLCPYCHSDLYRGPSGGASTNMFCGDLDCNSRFNIIMIKDVPWGEFTGTCPADFIHQRREDVRQAARDVARYGMPF